MTINLDRAEESLNDLIERRALEAEAANREAEQERQQQRRFLSRYQREFERLAEEHRERLGRLIDGVL